MGRSKPHRQHALPTFWPDRVLLPDGCRPDGSKPAFPHGGQSPTLLLVTPPVAATHRVEAAAGQWSGGTHRLLAAPEYPESAVAPDARVPGKAEPVSYNHSYPSQIYVSS